MVKPVINVLGPLAGLLRQLSKVNDLFEALAPPPLHIGRPHSRIAPFI